MVKTIQKGTRVRAEVDLGGIGVSAGDEFEVDDCNCHLDFEALLATGAVVVVRTVRSPALGGEGAKAEKGEGKPDAVKPALGGEGGR